MLVELSSTDTMRLSGGAGGCLMASTLQLKLLAILPGEWAIANLLQMNKNNALSCMI